MIQCEEYDIPKIHYEDEPIYYEEYKDRNVRLYNCRLDILRRIFNTMKNYNPPHISPFK